jgi:hypothetical protein
METIVQKTQQTLENMIVELKAQRAFHEQALAQITEVLETLETAAGSIAAPSAGTMKTKVRKPRGTKAKAAASSAPKAKVAGKKGAPKKAAPKKAAATKAKKSTDARLATNTAKLDPNTAVDAVGFSPRIVKFLKGFKIGNLAELATKDIRTLAAAGDRIGEGAIKEMFAAIKRAGLKPAETAKANGVPAATAAHV